MLSTFFLPPRTELFSDYNVACVARRSVKRRIEQKSKWFFMYISYFCISYVLFVDVFTRSFDRFISMKFLIAAFLPVSPFIPTFPFINFGDFFDNLPVYCTLPVYYVSRNLPASPFIPPSPSIWNSRVPWKLWNLLYQLVFLNWTGKKFLSHSFQVPYRPE